MNLKQINLNLLKAFDVLVTESNVTKASEKLHITQAAMSNTLNQLRELFDDPLFIRQAKGMMPTAKALQLAPKVKQALCYVERVFIEEEFDPKTAKHSFRVAVSSYCELIFIPKLMLYLQKHAPGLSLRLTHFCASEHADIALKKDIDMVIGPIQTECANDCSECVLATDDAVCIMHCQHPLAKKTLTMSNYQKYPHVAVNFEPKKESTFIDEFLANHGVERNVICTFTQVAPALMLIKQQRDLIGTYPAILCEQLQDRGCYAIKKPPFSVPTCEFRLRWHQRYDNDPAHQWLREALLSLP